MPRPSLFRYPGGKSWLVPYVRLWLSSLGRPLHLVEPFAGGATIGLTAAIEGLADSVTLIELDRDVAAVWQTVLSDRASDLANRILDFRISRRAVNKVLAGRCNSDLSRAFATLVRNRTSHGGKLVKAASLLNRGEKGNGIRSRWYPETLRKRIETISEHRSKITFIRGDGVKYIRSHRGHENLAFFIDPPYMMAGRRLYNHSDVARGDLFEIVANVHGSILMTYDNTSEIRELALRFGFETKRVRMRTTHHSTKTELLIGRDLSWCDRSLL